MIHHNQEITKKSIITSHMVVEAGDKLTSFAKWLKGTVLTHFGRGFITRLWICTSTVTTLHMH